MPGAPTVRQLLITIGLCLATTLTSAAAAQQMVSVKVNSLNMRSGPSTRTGILWELKRGYPLKVLKRQHSWLQVRDFEGDTGWVARSLTGRTPYHIVKSRIVNVRKGPGTRNRIVATAEYGDLLRTREKRGSWVRVETAEGKKGWVARRLLWGW